MNRRSTNRVALALAMLFLATASPHASAQSAGRAPVRGGEIQGLELGLEGALRVPSGGTLRWLLAAYEVIGTSDLRLAPGAEIQLTTSLDPSAAPTIVRTDAHGRAAIELAIPTDAPPAFNAVIRISSRSVVRRFELTVRVEQPRALSVQIARQSIPRGGVAHVFGRLWNATTGRPTADAEVRLSARDDASRPVATPVMVRTDAGGLYAHSFRLRREVVGSISVDARAEDDDDTVVANAGASVGDPQPGRLIVALAPERRVAPPDAPLAVDVVVRTSEGRPVRGARVELSGLAHDDPSRGIRTDARGRARITWRTPSIGAPWSDVSISASVSHESLGDAYAQTTVRIARVEWAGAVAVEGGALVPELGGRVYVRVVAIDGHPAAAGVPVRLAGPRLLAGANATEQTAATDASGVATFDVRIAPSSADPTPRCGGDAQAAARIRIGDGAGAYTLDSCLPLDPDGTARVRVSSARVRSGAAVGIEVARAPSIDRGPIVVSLLSIDHGGPRAIAARVLAPGETRVDIPLPADVVGGVLVRARSLGAGGRELRGGSAFLWVESGEPIAIDAALDAHGLRVERHGPAYSAWSVALPLDEALQLAATVRAESFGPLSTLGVELASASDALVRGALAAATPLDTAAPWVLRAGQPVAVPAPSDPIAAALLRDPWRAQSRFVTGRLALVFQAIERHVGASVPEHIDDVAVRTGARWDFNAQILVAVAESGELGGEGATGLGGEALTVEALRRFDPAFTYDHVASRITRERLFRLLLALRSFVAQNAFDLPWARVGDPSTWLRHLTSMYVQGVGQIQPRELVDAWGRPFLLRRVTGRARFTSWAPLDGWELFSSGPDGTAGNGDDVADPSARVLPSGSPYAQAVGEDILLARLNGVELGRATVDLMRGVVSVSVGGVPSEPEAAAQRAGIRLWSDLPVIVETDPEPLALRRPARPGEGAGGRLALLGDPPTVIDLSAELDEEPREWGAVVFASSADGSTAVASARARLGSPLIVEARLPARLRAGEPVVLALDVTNASERDRQLEVALRSDGPLEGRAGPITLRPGTSARVHLELRGTSTGRARAELVFLEQGEPIRTVRWNVAIDAGLHPLRVRGATALVGNEWHTTLEIPSDAERPLARVVVMQPSSLHRDPDLRGARERDPAILAWASVLAGHPIDPDLRARLLALQQYDGHFEGSDPSVSTACAIVALSSIAEDDPDAAAAAERARGALESTGTGSDETDGDALIFRGWAQSLAALASAGAPDLADDAESMVDPVARHATRLRTWLRRALRRFPEEPSILARAAAALLLADPRDAYGRAMLERAAAHLEEVRSGGGLRVVPSAAREGGIESLSATLALSVAAHQAGDDALAARLVAGALDRDHVIARRAGEPVFWLLAAASYGVLGTGDPQGLELTVNGRAQPVTFEGGVALVPIEGVRAGQPIDVRVTRAEGGPAVVVRAEAILERPYREAAGDAVELELAGDAGDVESVAALELTVRARRALRGGAIVDLQLPAGVVADDALIGSLRSAGGVVRVEPREPGFVRIVIGPLDAGVAIVIPLPLRWSVQGDVGGLAVIAHPADDPGAMTILASRTLSIAASEDLE